MILVEPQWYEVPERWPVIEPWVKRALARGAVNYDAADIRRELLCRDMKLWLAMDGSRIAACCITKLGAYPKLRICSIIVIGGTGMANWLHFKSEIEAYARENGAEALEGVGRTGWERAAKDWDKVATIYRKML